MSNVRGLHHITAIAGPAQENLDFYAGVLGMRLVKKSVNQDDPGTYHLFYADAEGHPGTDLTFFPWAQHGAAAHGHGLSVEVVADSAAGQPRVLGASGSTHYGVTGRSRSRRGSANASLPLVDPHGLRVALVEARTTRRAAVHAVGRQPGAGRAADPRARQRAAVGARARADDAIPDRGARVSHARGPKAAGTRYGVEAATGRTSMSGRRPTRVAAPGASAASTTSRGGSTTSAHQAAVRAADRRRRAPADAGHRSLLVQVGLLPRARRRALRARDRRAGLRGRRGPRAPGRIARAAAVARDTSGCDCSRCFHRSGNPR